MDEILWWHWSIFGLGLILAELAVPSFVIVWFGLGGLLVGLALFLFPALSLAAQIMIWTLSSIAMVVLWFRVFKRNYHKVLIGRASAALVGEVGMITTAVAPFKNGKVRFQKPMVGSDVWDCVSEDAIDVGVRVRVEKVEGNIVTVKKLEG